MINRSRVAAIVALTIFLRVVVVFTTTEEVFCGEYYAFPFFILPSLVLISVLMIFVPATIFWSKQETVTRAGVVILFATFFNAVLQIIDTVNWNQLCDVDSYFFAVECLCESLIFLQIVNVPFLFIGGIVLLIWLKRN